MSWTAVRVKPTFPPICHLAHLPSPKHQTKNISPEKPPIPTIPKHAAPNPKVATRKKLQTLKQKSSPKRKLPPSKSRIRPYANIPKVATHPMIQSPNPKSNPKHKPLSLKVATFHRAKVATKKLSATGNQNP
jgi:hypothetical protein